MWHEILLWIVALTIPWIAFNATDRLGRHSQRRFFEWRKRIQGDKNTDQDELSASLYALPDWLHKPEWLGATSYRWIADISSHIYPALACYVYPEGIRTHLVYTALVYMLRAPLFSMTVLPPCNPHQKFDEGKAASVELLPMPGGVSANGATNGHHVIVSEGNEQEQKSAWFIVRWAHRKWETRRQLNYGYGIDLCPSGHTCLMACSIFHLAPVVSGSVYLGLLGSASLVSLWIVITRCHYLVDIPWAWILARWVHNECYPWIDSWMRPSIASQ